MADFLLELRSEEIPARMQAKARNDLSRLFAEAMEAAGLATGAIATHSGPRRLVLIAREVAAATEASREELKGPRVSAPAQALDGFLRKTGLSKAQLEDREGVWFAAVERPGRTAADVISEAVGTIVADFPWPKAMRWGERSATPGALNWVRPLHSIVAMFGPETEDPDMVPFALDGIKAGDITYGHRFMAPGDRKRWP